MAKRKHLRGTKLVLTGDFDSYERDEAVRVLEDLGADVTGSVSGKTMAVIVGKNPGATKLGQAKKRGLPVLTEAQMLELIAGRTLAETLSASKSDAKSGASKATSEPEKPRVEMPFRPAPPRDGVYVEHFPGTERIAVSGTYKDGLKHGSWKVFHENGQLKEDYAWERGLRHGHELDWAENGAKICDGRNERGKRVGTWTWWHANGKRMNAYTYDDRSRRQGSYVSELEDGTPGARGQWLDDEYHGAWTWWHEDGFEMIERHFHRGYQHGSDMAWHPGGRPASRCSFRFGRKHGEEEVFDAQGRPTYKGGWRFGNPVGEHIHWDQDRKETRTTYVDGLPAAIARDVKRRDKVLKKLKKAKSSYAKGKVIGEAVEYNKRAAYLVHLWKGGHVNAAADPELWELVAEAHGLVSSEEVVKLLKGAKTAGEHGNVLPYWPCDLDRIVMEAYGRDPKPIDAALPSLPGPMRNGVHLVRARFGHDIGDALFSEMPALVRNYVEHYGLSDVLWPDDGGMVVRKELFSDYHGTKTPLFDQLVGLFGGRGRWLVELRSRAFANAEDVPFRLFRDVIETATPDEVAALIRRISLNNETHEYIELALTQWRADDAATTARIALAVQDDGLRKWPTVSAAILRLASEGAPVPQELVDALPLAAESPTYTSSWYTEPLRAYDDRQKKLPAVRMACIDSAAFAATPSTAPVQRAMRALTPQQARSVIERHLAAEHGKSVVAQFLHLVADPALWERFLDWAESDTYGHCDTIMYGVGELGLRAVPMLVARLLRAKTQAWKEGWHKAVLVALARGVVDEGGFDAELDRFVRFDVGGGASNTYLPFLERILWKLPSARSEAILLAGLRSPQFARAFRLLACAPTEAALETAVTELFAREKMLKYEEQNDVGEGLSSLHNAIDWVRFIKESGGGGGLGDALPQAIGWDVYEALEKELAAVNAPQAEPIDDVEKLRLRAEEAGGGNERIYLLRRLEGESARDDHNVIGGPAPGVDASRWPSYDDEPMQHLFTLDVQTMPELSAYVGRNVRLVSVFCWQPDNNEAYEPGNGKTAVVTTTKAQLKAGGAPPEEAELREEARFEAVAVDVSPEVWLDSSELYQEIYRAHARVLGEPLWLQSEEDEGGSGSFLMQFDEGFVSMNLGDGGIMYVFGDTAWWQCH